ncbi:MAG: hypothetical protein RL318_1512 [Fibrobacterota bacterium]|jgi:hypothetical protein
MKLSIPLLLATAIPSLAATWQVGPGRTYAAPRAVAGLVADGDTVLIDAGTYADEVATWSRSRLLLRGVGGFAHLKAPASISNGKAIWVLSGNDITLDSIEFSGAAVPDLNGAGIRAEGTNLTIRRSHFHDNENGILGGKGHVRIEDSEFARNGHGDGLSHNMYISNCDTFTLLRSYSHHAKIGHEVKSRAKVNIIVGNWIGNEANGTASYEIDLPNGGTSLVAGNFIQQSSSTDNSTLVTFGEEGLSNPGKDLHLVHNTLVNDRGSGTFVRLATGATGTVINNLWVGEGTWISGTADTARNLHGTGADLINRSGFDFRLAPTSSAINAGVITPSFLGYAQFPAWQFLRGTGPQSRLANSAPDIGAWETTSANAIGTRMPHQTTARAGMRFDPRSSREAGTITPDGRIQPAASRATMPGARP